MAPRTAAKQTANGRTRTPRPVPATVIAPIELTDDVIDEFTEREPLFSLKGTVYTIPVRVPVADTLRYAEIWVEQGTFAALIWAMKQTIGEDGYRALTQHKTLTTDQIGKITDAVRGKFDGSSSPKGPRKTG